MELERAVIVQRKTTLDELVQRHATLSQVQFLLKDRPGVFELYTTADRAYKDSIRTTLQTMPTSLRTEQVTKDLLGTYQFGAKDLVVVVGDDGLFVNTAKYAQEQPIIFVNADPERFDGVLASCIASEFGTFVSSYLASPWKAHALTMAKACLDDGQVLYALNDFYIGKRGHSSARYTIEHAGQKEAHSSSGIIVSTGTGSTGWLTSILRGARTIVRKMDGNADPDPREFFFGRDADYLIFVVQEAFPSKVTGTDIVYGKITRDNKLEITSQMPENGYIFSDGIEADCMEFAAGRKLTIELGERKVSLIGSKK